MGRSPVALIRSALGRDGADKRSDSTSRVAAQSNRCLADMVYSTYDPGLCIHRRHALSRAHWRNRQRSATPRKCCAFDIEPLLCDLRCAGESDDVNDSIDYGAVYSAGCRRGGKHTMQAIGALGSNRIADGAAHCEISCMRSRRASRVGKPALFPHHGTFRHAGRGNRPQPSRNDCGSANTSGLAHL